MLKNLFAVALVVTAPVLQAQVRVIESSPQGFGSGVAQSQAPASVESDVYSQIRALQDEVTNLRGLLEEQAYELKQLKQLQLDNYMDIDRRLSGGAQPVSATNSSDTSMPEAVASSTPTQPAASRLSDTATENEAYKAAYDLLNMRDYGAATQAFNDHLERFPNGEFASNSHYWLGKLAMLKKDYPQAKTWFGKLITNFPDTAKVPDAQLDLGKVYFLMGEKSKAKAVLTEVANGHSDAARLAQKFLDENFQ